MTAVEFLPYSRCDEPLGSPRWGQVNQGPLAHGHVYFETKLLLCNCLEGKCVSTNTQRVLILFDDCVYGDLFDDYELKDPQRTKPSCFFFMSVPETTASNTCWCDCTDSTGFISLFISSEILVQ